MKSKKKSTKDEKKLTSLFFVSHQQIKLSKIKLLLSDIGWHSYLNWFLQGHEDKKILLFYIWGKKSREGHQPNVWNEII